MGLYLAIFEGDEELDGLEVGSYADFNEFRDHVTSRLEDDRPGSRFPLLVIHSDCDGCWEGEACAALEKELEKIKEEFQNLPPLEIGQPWKVEVARLFGIRPANLDECFFDVDGEPLTDRVIGLCRLAGRKNLPIWFQ